MINSNFNKLSSAAFLAQVERIVTAMSGNANFPEPWPATVPSLAQIQSDLAAFQAALTATQSGDRTRIVERNTARSKLSADLFVLANYVQTVAPNDDSRLVTTGFPLRQPAPRARLSEVPDAPAGFDVYRGTVSGTLVARASRVARAGSYDVQITTADPTVESNWTPAGSYKNCGRIELQGLTPGKTYTVRIRALGSAGPGAWATSESLMVV